MSADETFPSPKQMAAWLREYSQDAASFGPACAEALTDAADILEGSTATAPCAGDTGPKEPRPSDYDCWQHKAERFVPVETTAPRTSEASFTVGPGFHVGPGEAPRSGEASPRWEQASASLSEVGWDELSVHGPREHINAFLKAVADRDDALARAEAREKRRSEAARPATTVTEYELPASFPRLNSADDLPGLGTAEDPRLSGHVCGLTGFGRPGDVCVACEKRRERAKRACGCDWDGPSCDHERVHKETSKVLATHPLAGPNACVHRNKHLVSWPDEYDCHECGSRNVGRATPTPSAAPCCEMIGGKHHYTTADCDDRFDCGMRCRNNMMVCGEHHVAMRAFIAGVQHEERSAPSSWPAPAPVTRVETLDRLCKLLGDVWEHFDPEAHEAQDCLCSKREAWLTDARWRSSGQALAYIEKVVRGSLFTRSERKP